jgi:hypothetical protein
MTFKKYAFDCKKGAVIKLLIGCFFLGFLSAVHAEIQIATSLEPIEQEIENSPKKTLMLIDVGGTLLAYPDAVLHPDHETWKYQWFQAHCPALSKEDKIRFDRIVLTTLGSWKLHDDRWPELITQAQRHAIKVVAFTKVALDPSTRGSRAQILRDLGIPFNNDLPELSKGQSYEYAQGVIETEYQLKGPVLKEILSNLATRPEKIIFVDDRMKQIKRVDETCLELNIPCVAFHYIPTPKGPPLNEKIADYQLSTLVQESRWVPDEEARRALEKRLPQ